MINTEERKILDAELNEIKDIMHLVLCIEGWAQVVKNRLQAMRNNLSLIE